MVTHKEKQRREIEKFIEKMPSLSTTVGKVMEICSRTDASPARNASRRRSSTQEVLPDPAGPINSRIGY